MISSLNRSTNHLMRSIEFNFSHCIIGHVSKLAMEKELYFFSLDSLCHCEDTIRLHEGLNILDIHFSNELRSHLASDSTSLLNLHPGSLEFLRAEITCRVKLSWLDNWLRRCSSTEPKAIKSTSLWLLLLRRHTKSKKIWFIVRNRDSNARSRAKC